MENGTLKTFLDKLVLALNHENERRVGSKIHFLDVAFLVAPVEQHLAEPQFEEFTRFLEANDNYHLAYFRTPGEEEWMRQDRVQVSANTDDIYILTFGEDERMWGYCMCEPGQDGYDPRYKCCGDGCDWTAPAFAVEKRRTQGRASWEGIERDYWAYEEAFNAKLATMNADLDRSKRERKADHLRAEISRLQEQLREVG